MLPAQISWFLNGSRKRFIYYANMIIRFFKGASPVSKTAKLTSSLVREIRLVSPIDKTIKLTSSITKQDKKVTQITRSITYTTESAGS